MTQDETPIQQDVDLVGQLDGIDDMLRAVSEATHLGFAAVARVTDSRWVACAVHDAIGFGIVPGTELPIDTTLCKESRAARQPIVIADCRNDPEYRDHITPRHYDLGAYISAPIVLGDDSYFGNLCAVDRHPSPEALPRSVGLVATLARTIAREIDNARRLTAARRALSSAELTSEQRDIFIAILGHDLRDPVSAIATIGTLLQQPLTQRVDLASLGQRLVNSASRMSAMIDDVLDFARGRLGDGMAVSCEPYADLADRLSQVVSDIASTFPDRRIDSRIDIDGSVHCNPGRMQQLVSNLLRNALIHGATDQPVKVLAYLDGHELVIEVSNRGPVIEPPRVARIFEPFSGRAHRPSGGGLGLGLYICQQIVQAHGGQIVAASTTDSGTTMTARIPCVSSQDGRPRLLST